MGEARQNGWLSQLITQCNNLAEKFGLDDGMTDEMREFVIDVAREQYKIGNNSGIRYAHRQIEARTGGAAQAA